MGSPHQFSYDNVTLFTDLLRCMFYQICLITSEDGNKKLQLNKKQFLTQVMGLKIVLQGEINRIITLMYLL